MTGYESKKAAAQDKTAPVQFKCTVIDDAHPNGIPLEQWTELPQRKWVGLTDEEKQEAYYKIDLWSECIAFIEAKLKEKNT